MASDFPAAHSLDKSWFAVDQAVGPPGQVVDFRRGIDAEAPENRGGEIGRCDRVQSGVCAEAVARAMHIAAAHAAAGQED